MTATAERGPLRFLVFSASLRAESYNTRLANLARRAIEGHGGTVDLAAMADFDCPSYSQDGQTKNGFPPGADEFRRRLEATRGEVTVDGCRKSRSRRAAAAPRRSSTHP